MKKGRSMNENFGSMLLYLREKKQYSLQQLSDKTGICPTYIHKLEKNKRNCPSYPIVSKLAEALEVDVIDLLEVSTNHSVRSSLTFEQLVMSNSFAVEGVDEFTPQAKKSLLSLVDVIIDLDWEKETLIGDMYEVMQAVDEFKKGISA